MPNNPDLTQYLNEIGRYPLLSSEEEYTLAKQSQIEHNRDARQKLICSNLRFVVSVANDYVNYGLPISELISEGNLGLIKAVDRFDPENDANLATYAKYWIKKTIMAALSNSSRMIRIPAETGYKVVKYRKAIHELRETLDREPTKNEVQDRMGITRQTLDFLERTARVAQVTDVESEDDIAGVRRIAWGVIKNHPDSSPSTESELIFSEDLSKMRMILSTSHSKEFKLVRSYYGIDCPEVKLTDYAREQGFTHQNASLILKRGIEELRIRMGVENLCLNPTSTPKVPLESSEANGPTTSTYTIGSMSLKVGSPITVTESFAIIRKGFLSAKRFSVSLELTPQAEFIPSETSANNTSRKILEGNTFP